MLVLGVILVGGGFWLSNSLTPRIPTPEGEPAIVMKTTQIGGGSESYLSIYPDGTVINIEDIRLRQSTAEYPPARILKTGKLTGAEYASLTQFIKDNADKLETYYQFPGVVNASGTIMGDMDIILQLDFDGVTKSLQAVKFLAPYSNLYLGTYAGMPSPLAEVCERLNNIAIGTTEISRENLKITFTEPE